MMGIDREFDFIMANVVENMSNTGEIDVDAILLIKYPLSLPRHRTSLFLHCPFGLLSFKYGHKAPLRSFYLR